MDWLLSERVSACPAARLTRSSGAFSIAPEKITVASPASPPITAPFRSKLCVPLPTLYQREGKAFAAQRVIRIGPHFLKKGSGGGGDFVQEVASKRQNRSGVGSCRSFRA
jgi:hypothetical protein